MFLIRMIRTSFSTVADIWAAWLMFIADGFTELAKMLDPGEEYK